MLRKFTAWLKAFTPQRNGNGQKPAPASPIEVNVWYEAFVDREKGVAYIIVPDRR